MRPRQALNSWLLMDCVPKGRQDKACHQPERAQEHGTLDVNIAFDLHEAGRLDEAAALCESIIAQNPSDAAAHYLLGTILADGRDLHAARHHLHRASLAPSDRGLAFFNLAQVCLRLRDFPAAVTALAEYRTRNPQDVNGSLLDAEIILAKGDLDKAITCIRELLAFAPGFAPAHLLLARALQTAGDLAAARKHYEHAAEHHESRSEAKLHLAALLIVTGEIAEAETLYEGLLKDETAKPQALAGLAGLQLKKGDIETAKRLADEAHQLAPRDPIIWGVLAAVFRETGALDEALHLCSKLKITDPCRPDLHLLEASIFHQKGLHEKAIDACTAGISLDPALHEAFLLRGMQELLLWDFENGWRDYEHRLSCPRIHRESLRRQQSFINHGQRWPERTTLQGKKLLLIEEQGLGDTIMFASIFDDLLQDAQSITALVDERLIGLMQASFPKIDFLPLDERPSIEHFDVTLFTGSLGHAYRRSAECFPRRPYLRLPSLKKSLWDNRLASWKDKKKIGLSWRGGTPSTNQKGRTLAGEDLLLLAQDTEAVFFNLQHGASGDEVGTLRNALGDRWVSFPPDWLGDIADLAACIDGLDAVVTMQNTNVHVSGALGKTCHVIVPEVPSWNYGARKDTMCWYASTTLWRRDPSIAVGELLTRLRSQLARFLH
jgi:tetratricopeptide (TPR) repeat protein